jgi:hypothetical protein
MLNSSVLVRSTGSFGTDGEEQCDAKKTKVGKLSVAKICGALGIFPGFSDPNKRRDG